MSYEGCVQHLCPNGHYWVCDCYADSDICPYCKYQGIWWHGVDQTNGYGDFRKLRVVERRTCDKCGSILETRYELLEGK